MRSTREEVISPKQPQVAMPPVVASPSLSPQALQRLVQFFDMLDEDARIQDKEDEAKTKGCKCKLMK